MRVVFLALFVCTAAEVTNPVARVVDLIQGLKTKIVSDGKKEQVIYDKYACWCEDTSGRKATAISEAKNTISELSESILKLKGRLGSYQAEIQGLNKNIQENKEAQTSAEGMRKQENTDYVKAKAAYQQGIENLGKAIQVLGDATSSQGVSHLSKADPMRPSMVETKMLTVVAGVRSAMALYSKHNDGLKEDFSTMKSFLSNPAAWVQTNSPHKEEYSTQSGAIQGMLKDMHDSFQRDLESANDAEGVSQDDYDKLMATKRGDLNLLQSDLTAKTLGQGNDAKQLADESQLREETQKQLAIDEEFLDTTKQGCKDKADEWSERSRLRTEELHGISEAVDILTAPNATATFATADTSLLQMSSVHEDSVRTQAYKILKQTATESNDVHLAMIAAKIKSGTTWHFDGVIADIEKMKGKLRQEAQDDIEHRDWCESERNAANSQNEQLQYDKQQLQNKVDRATGVQGQLMDDVSATDGEKRTLISEMETALEIRNTENAAFKDAVKADTDAVSLISKAIGALSKYYAKNPALLRKHSLVRKHRQPEYTESEDTAPSADFSSSTSSNSQNTGIVSILSMIKEDLENEMKVARGEEAAADKSYRQLTQESRDALAAMAAKVVDLKDQWSAKGKEIADTQKVHDNKAETESSNDAYLLKLKANCDWIRDQFTSRQTDRKKEIAGLDKAAGALAGMKGATGLVAKASHVAAGPTVEDKLKELDEAEKSFGFTSFLQRK